MLPNISVQFILCELHFNTVLHTPTLNMAGHFKFVLLLTKSPSMEIPVKSGFPTLNAHNKATQLGRQENIKISSTDTGPACLRLSVTFCSIHSVEKHKVFVASLAAEHHPVFC